MSIKNTTITHCRPSHNTMRKCYRTLDTRKTIKVKKTALSPSLTLSLSLSLSLSLCHSLSLVLPHHKPQTTLWHREEEPLNHHETPGRQIKQSNQLSLPHQDDCNTRMDTSIIQQNIEQLKTPTMGVTINKKSTTTESPP